MPGYIRKGEFRSPLYKFGQVRTSSD